METFNNEIMGDLLSGSLKSASIDASGWHDSNAGGSTTDGKFIEWLTIYDCKSGSLVEVPEATEAGKAS